MIVRYVAYTQLTKRTFTKMFAYLALAVHDLQNQFLHLGCLIRPTHLKWNHSRHESHTMDCSEWRSWWHEWQIQATWVDFCLKTSWTNIQASVVKCFRTRWMSTFSSRIESGNFSGLHSTSSSSMRSLCFNALAATLSSTNHDNITIRWKQAYIIASLNDGHRKNTHLSPFQKHAVW